MTARRLLAIPVTSRLQPPLYACPLFAAVLQSLSEAAKSITSNNRYRPKHFALCNIVLYAYSNSHAGANWLGQILVDLVKSF
jgi:hypothetical protein